MKFNDLIEQQTNFDFDLKVSFLFRFGEIQFVVTESQFFYYCDVDEFQFMA